MALPARLLEGFPKQSVRAAFAYGCVASVDRRNAPSSFCVAAAVPSLAHLTRASLSGSATLLRLTFVCGGLTCLMVHTFNCSSAVFRQAHAGARQNRQLDAIIVVDDAAEFHKANVVRNPRHYALAMRAAGADNVRCE